MTKQMAGVLAACIWATGCSGERLVTVTGVATHAGKPVPNLAIHFAPKQGLRSFALTDQDGKFIMMHNSGKPGVVVGQHRVWVDLPKAGAAKDPQRRKRLEAQQADAAIAKILGRYGSEATTPLEFTIDAPKEIALQLD